MLSGSVAFQRLELIAGRDAQIVESARDLQLAELASRDRLDARKPRDPPALASRSVSPSVNDTIMPE